jgi:N-acetylmuramoyl-L-alanine amidase
MEGWAFSGEGIEEVSVYIDRQYIVSARTGFQRPDVAHAFPNTPQAKTSGWRASVDVSKMAPGRHDVVVQAISRNGSTRDIASFQAIVVK